MCCAVWVHLDVIFIKYPLFFLSFFRYFLAKQCLSFPMWSYPFVYFFCFFKSIKLKFHHSCIMLGVQICPSFDFFVCLFEFSFDMIPPFHRGGISKTVTQNGKRSKEAETAPPKGEVGRWRYVHPHHATQKTYTHIRAVRSFLFVRAFLCFPFTSNSGCLFPVIGSLISVCMCVSLLDAFCFNTSTVTVTG